METWERAFTNYTDNLKKELARCFPTLCDAAYYREALALIEKTTQNGGRIHVSGIGKPHHISGYYASLLSSIGYRAYLLDGTEATHGSSGQVAPDDVVLLLSYYGNPEELVKTARTLKAMGVSLIAITGFDDSVIARLSDVHLNVFVEKEGDSLGKPPRLSMLTTMICLQNLSVLLQERSALSHETYLQWHPSGELGRT